MTTHLVLNNKLTPVILEDSFEPIIPAYTLKFVFKKIIKNSFFLFCFLPF